MNWKQEQNVQFDVGEKPSYRANPRNQGRDCMGLPYLSVFLSDCASCQLIVCDFCVFVCLFTQVDEVTGREAVLIKSFWKKEMQLKVHQLVSGTALGCSVMLACLPTLLTC